MKLRYLFFLCSFFALSDSHLSLLANTTQTKTILESAAILDANNDLKNTVESIGDLLQQKQLTDEIITILNCNQKHPYKIKKALIKVYELLNKRYSKEKAINVILNNKESEEFYARKNALAKSKTRNLLLKVIIPVGITAVIFYLLYYYYKTIFQSARPNFSLWKLFSTDFWQSFLWQTIEVVIAITRLSSVGGKTNSIIVDALRITNCCLFLINKKQFSIEAFKQGAYYSESWLIYDVFHLIKTFYNDAITEEMPDVNPVSGKKDVQFEQTGKMLCLYLLPVAESAAALYLALHSSETPAAIKARKNVQTVYSLLRILPIYLKVKRDTVDALLAVHILIVFLDFWHNSRVHSNGTRGKTGIVNPNPSNHDTSTQQNNSDNQPTESAQDKQSVDKNAPDGEQPKYVSSTTSDGMSQERQFVLGNPVGEHVINDELLTELTQKLDDMIHTYPELAHLETEEFSSDIHEDSADKEPIDTRSIRIILEEKLKYAKALIRELKQPPYNLERQLNK